MFIRSGNYCFAPTDIMAVRPDEGGLRFHFNSVLDDALTATGEPFPVHSILVPEPDASALLNQLEPAQAQTSPLTTAK